MSVPNQPKPCAECGAQATTVKHPFTVDGAPFGYAAATPPAEPVPVCRSCRALQHSLSALSLLSLVLLAGLVVTMFIVQRWPDSFILPCAVLLAIFGLWRYAQRRYFTQRADRQNRRQQYRWGSRR